VGEMHKFSMPQTGKFLLGISLAFVKLKLKNQFSKTANFALILKDFAVSFTEVRVSRLKNRYKCGTPLNMREKRDGN